MNVSPWTQEESLEGHWDGGADSGLAAVATEVESDKCVIEFEEVGEVIDDYLESSDFQQGFIMNDKCWLKLAAFSSSYKQLLEILK